MALYKEQIERVKEKLPKARKADKHYDVFGAVSVESKCLKNDCLIGIYSSKHFMMSITGA